MQKFRKTKIVVSILIIASLIITTISPIASAAATFDTEGKVKNALYAAAAYECISNTVLQNTAVGNKRDSIMASADTQKVFIGQWLGDSSGMITCKDALTKTLGSGNITANMLESGQVLNGVYTQSAGGEQQIKCNYGIVNSSGNATMDGTYSWPQGYIKDNDGNIQDKRSHGTIQIVFNESGPVRLVGSTGDIDTTHTLESMKNISIDWSKPEKICSNLVMYTDVYPTGQVQNPMGETISTYTTVLATTDSTPFNEWGIHVDDKYHAWVSGTSTNTKFTHTLSTVSSSTQLELTSDAKTKLLSNISTLYLNGATSVEGLLNSSADAKYILYGRYLFNGDGSGSFACGGVSVATDDPDFSELSATDYWDTSQPYVAVVNAYKDSTATSKTTFRTKFGGDGLLTPGSAKSIYFPGVAGDCKAVANEFNNITPSSTTAKAAVKNFMKVGSVEELPNTNTPGSTDPDNSGGGDVGALDGCFSNAGVLGWILCPVLRAAGAATEGIYNGIEENYLMIKSSTITSGPLEETWGTFQGYANIFFAILLIVVILSQVTGIGLSNYNIKKVLPKLIVTVVLVNVSFIICEICVDLSNIVGVQLNDFFSGMDAGGFAAADLNVGTMVKNSIEGIGLGAIAIGAGVASVPVIVDQWPKLILLLLLAVISVLISILFFYILLVVRQAAVIVLIAIAPMAIVCYALPNTQKLFDRWFKMFSSLLFVFPICGAMMGGCNFASRLLLSAGGDNGLLYYIIVMVLGVAPLFFIPSLLRTSLNAIGGLGAKITAMGSRFNGWTSRTIRGSKTFQERMGERQREVDMRRNSRIAKSVNSSKRYQDLQTRVEAGEVLAGRDKRDYERLRLRRARALSGNRKIYNEDNMAEATSRGEDYAKIEQNNPRRLAAIQQYRGRDTEDLSRGYSTMYQNDGTAGSTAEQQKVLDKALTDLEADSENQDAQARFKAVVRMMSTSDKGRATLENTLNKHIKAQGDAGNEHNKGLRWASNTALDGPNGKEFKKVAPSLFQTLSDVAEGGDNHKLTDMAGRITMRTEVDPNTGATREIYADTSDDAYKVAIDRMSSDLLPEIDDRDFERYIQGMKDNKITGTARAKLINSAIDALNDPRIKLKPKTAGYVHQIANMKYTEHTSDPAKLHGPNINDIHVEDAAALTAAGGAELDRISEGLKTGAIAKDDPSDPTKRSDVLNVMHRALEEARTHGGSVNGVQLSAGDASKMVKILQEYGSGRGINPADYSSLMRIRHNRARYSSDWRQVQTGDLINPAFSGLHEGDWVDTSGGAPRRLTTEEMRKVQSVEDFNVRQATRESADNNEDV